MVVNSLKINMLVISMNFKENYTTLLYIITKLFQNLCDKGHGYKCSFKRDKKVVNVKWGLCSLILVSIDKAVYIGAGSDKFLNDLILTFANFNGVNTTQYGKFNLPL